MRKLILLSAVIVLSACQSDESQLLVNDSAHVTTSSNVRIGKLLDVTTTNGVDCVVFFAEKKGGISCNWEKYNREMSENNE